MNEECVPSEPAKDGSVSGLPARATGNNETTSGIPAGDAEKGGATDALKTSRTSGDSVSKYRARVISVGDVGGDSGAVPSLHASIMLLKETKAEEYLDFKDRNNQSIPHQSQHRVQKATEGTRRQSERIPFARRSRGTEGVFGQSGKSMVQAIQ